MLFPILMYHQVVPEDRLPDDSHLYLTPQRLQEQIRGIRRMGFELVTMAEGCRRLSLGGGISTFRRSYL